MHPDKTCFADRVVYYKCGDPHVAFVMKTHDDDPHMACLVCYCPKSHAWFEAYNIPFGNQDSDGNGRDEYFINPDA